MFIGFLALGYYGYIQTDTYLFQDYQSWRLDQMQQRKPASITLYLKQWVPIPWADDGSTAPATLPGQRSQGQQGEKGTNSPTPGPVGSGGDLNATPGSTLERTEGSLLGKIMIPSLKLSAIILEGVQPETLRLAVGHLPGTPLPGETGNVDLAAHRDTFFRGLRNVQKGALISLSTVSGATYEYRVESLAVVSPNSADMLNAFPGPGVNLITCYPFSYLGPAPKRYVVHAVEVSATDSAMNRGRPDPGRKNGSFKSSRLESARFDERSNSALPHAPTALKPRTSPRPSPDSHAETTARAVGTGRLKTGEGSTPLVNGRASSGMDSKPDGGTSRSHFSRVHMFFQKIIRVARSIPQAMPGETSAGN
ncbi:MAG TPA: class D sortase [Terriglobia bacterium]|nr:class D sortase [Terriglobia bacterium]